MVFLFQHDFHANHFTHFFVDEGGGFSYAAACRYYNDLEMGFKYEWVVNSIKTLCRVGIRRKAYLGGWKL